MSYSHPGAWFRTWHVFVFLVAVVVAVEIASVHTMGTKTEPLVVSGRSTSAPPAPAPAPVPEETVDVLVAAKDLPVGTVFLANEKLWVTKKLPKDGLPPGVVTSTAELTDKRLSRPMRAGETFNSNDLNRGLALPDGTDLVSIPVASTEAYLVPGSRADVFACLRVGDALKVFDLLVNVLVVCVNQDIVTGKDGAASTNMVGFALTRKQAMTLELARARGCHLSLKLRNDKRGADEDKDYDIDAVIKLLTGLPDPPPPAREPAEPLPAMTPPRPPDGGR